MVRTRRYLAALTVMAALATSVVALWFTLPAQAGSTTANTIAVTTADDAGAGSLREAITTANDTSAEDRIVFGLGASAMITLATALPAITDSAGLTIDGKKADISISGNDQVRVFLVSSGAKLALSNLTVEKGLAQLGSGGGIYNSGTLTVSGSTLSANSASSGGGTANSGKLVVRNSTLSGNTASNSGGGILNSGGATLTISNSTLSDNSANSGGGIDNEGTAALRNAIVANSTSDGDCSGTITDGGYNLSSDISCGFKARNKSLPSVKPMLGPLADNGGPTQTHALLKDSPAVDKGKSFGETTDQLGLPRPFDLGVIDNAPRGDGSDIGAYEQLRCSGDVVNAAGAVVGTRGPDNLRDEGGNDTILGLGGNDRIWGLDGNDTVCSGKGDDRVEGGPGDDYVEGSEGKDFLHGGQGKDDLYGLKGEDTLKANDGLGEEDLADGGARRDICKTEPDDVRKSC